MLIHTLLVHVHVYQLIVYMYTVHVLQAMYMYMYMHRSLLGVLIAKLGTNAHTITVRRPHYRLLNTAYVS